MRKRVGIIKRVSCISLVFLLSINSFAAIVSDNDGAAFITKAEFDTLKNDFQAQIDSYNTSIDNKIDGAIASYLAGIQLSTKEQISSILKNDYTHLNMLSSTSRGSKLNLLAYGNDTYMWTRPPVTYAEWSFIGTKSKRKIVFGKFDKASLTFSNLRQFSGYTDFTRTVISWEGKNWASTIAYNSPIAQVSLSGSWATSFGLGTSALSTYWDEVSNKTSFLTWNLDTLVANAPVSYVFTAHDYICNTLDYNGYPTMHYGDKLFPIMFKNESGGNGGFIPLNYTSNWHSSLTQNVQLVEDNTVVELLGQWHDSPEPLGLIVDDDMANAQISFNPSDNTSNTFTTFNANWKYMVSNNTLSYTGTKIVNDIDSPLIQKKITGSGSRTEGFPFHEHAGIDPFVIPYAWTKNKINKLIFDIKTQTTLTNAQIIAAGLSNSRIDRGIPLFYIEKDGTVSFQLQFMSSTSANDNTNSYDCWFTKGPLTSDTAIVSTKPSNCYLVEANNSSGGKILQAANGSITIKSNNRITITNAKKNEAIYINFRKSGGTNGGIIKLPVQGELQFEK